MTRDLLWFTRIRLSLSQVLISGLQSTSWDSRDQQTVSSSCVSQSVSLCVLVCVLVYVLVCKHMC